MIFNPEDEQGAHALRRLIDDRIAWLTTVTPSGQPQSTPIWFLWADGEILIYSDHRALRNRNIAANPRVSLHLDDDGEGGDIVVVQGEARIDPGQPPVPANAPYLAKYGQWIDAELGGPDKMAETYSVAIVIKPTRGTAFPG
ncbi:MAG: TIGR03667 family PPOX class F420-dependent oxidoreductase [Chloroflexi bacterium]|nr:TIGR03667 family PPOX class F420-dependent oxidoreductase [Chloroflexota bacterium]